MSDLGTAYVQIVPSAQGIGQNIGKAISPGASSAGVSAGKSIASNIGSTLSTAGSRMMKVGAVATAISVPIIAGIKKALSAYEVQTSAETKLTEIYKTRMGVGKKAAEQTMELASALQKEGVIGDEVQLSGAQQLATFAKMPDTINTLLPAMNNLLAQQKGYNATAEDATSIGNLMGKVMQGQVGALKRVGVTFDENQEKILKTGTEEEKAAVLAQVITDNVGNMNETLANTPLGQIQQMKNTMGDLAEQVGATLAPALSQVANYISATILPVVENIVNFLQANPVIAQIVLGITGVLAVGGPLLIFIGAIVSSIGALIPVITAITAPMIGVAAAIAGVIAVLAIIWAKCDTFRQAVINLASSIAEALSPVISAAAKFFKLFIKEVTSTATAIGNALAPVIKLFTPVITLLAKVFATKLIIGFKIAGALVKTVANAIKAAAAIIQGVATGLGQIFGSIAKTISKHAGGIKDAITKPFSAAKDMLKGIIDKIKGFFPLNIGKIFSGMKLPHFTISGGKAPFGIGGLGTKPKIDVSWYAKGGIMSQPTLFGGGEAGDEAIVPLDPFWKRLESMNSGNTFNITMNVDGAKDPSQWAREFSRTLELEMRTI